jgi:hypothetical protein
LIELFRTDLARHKSSLFLLGNKGAINKALEKGRKIKDSLVIQNTTASKTGMPKPKVVNRDFLKNLPE